MTEEFLRALIRHFPLGYAYHRLVLNEQGEPVDYIFLETNDAFGTSTGLDTQDIIGRRVTEVIPGIRSGGFDWVAYYGQMTLKRTSHTFNQYESTLKRWYKVTVFSPEELHFATIFQDITEEMRNIDALKTGKREVQNLSRDMEIIFNSTQDALFLVEYRDDEFYYIRNNATHQMLTGLSVEDIRGKTPVEALGPEIGGQLKRAYLACIRSKAAYRYEETVAFPGGKRDWLVNLSPVEEDGCVRYIVGSRTDITEQKKLREETSQLMRRLFAMFNQHSVMMLVFDPESRHILDANPAACAFFGYEKEEMMALRADDIDLQASSAWPEILASSHSHHHTVTYLHKDRSQRILDMYSCLIMQGTSQQVFSIMVDVTDRERYKADLYREKELLHITLKSIGDGVVTTDTKGQITYLNDVAQELTGWDLDEAQGLRFSSILDLQNEDSRLPVENPISLVLKTGKVVGLANHTVLINRQGYALPIADSAAPIRDEQGRTFGVVMVFRDVSRDKEHQNQILYLSYHDYLTGLHNRRFIEEEFKRLEEEHQLPLAVIMGDVNGLKITNDVFGHERGDRLLQTVAATLRENCPEDGLVARWGGDEFLMLLPRTTAQEAQQLSAKMRREFAEKSEKDFHVSVSFGCAAKDHPEANLQRVFRLAEEWMYHQKLLDGQSYRNTIINTMLATLYEKSSETEEHAVRLRDICHNIAAELELSAEQMDELALLSILHDIGKVGISKNTLQKNGPLSEEEWEEMRRHPEIGYRIAQNTPELSQVSEYILSHHERWDGQGYPRGLAGEDIPILCRILAVADAFDAMTHDRYYRKALSKDYAITELRSNAGTQFDPDIVEVFLKIIDQAPIGPANT